MTYKTEKDLRNRSLLTVTLVCGLFFSLIIYFELIPSWLINSIQDHTDILDWWMLSRAYIYGLDIPNVVFNYPPLFALLILPIGFFDFKSVYFLFMMGTFAGYIYVVGSSSKSVFCAAIVSLSLSVVANFVYGQNGLLTAALAGMALLSLQHGRQVIAGIFIGLLTAKPHLGILFPVALLAIGAWRSIIAAVITAVLLFLSSILFFGLDSYLTWMQKFQIVVNFIQEVGYVAVPTYFSFILSSGGSIQFAYIVQYIVTFSMMLVVWFAWRNHDNWSFRSSVLLAATCLASPYIMLIDFTWLGLSLACFSQLVLKVDYTKNDEKFFYLMTYLVYLLPFIYLAIGLIFFVQIGQFLISIYLFLLYRSKLNSQFQ